MKVLLVIALLAAPACKKPRWQGDKAATELHLAGYTIAIPNGWRSLAELSPDQPEAGRLDANTVAMAPEIDVAGALTASIVVTTSSAPKWSTCAERVESVRREYSFPITDVHDAGSACTWHVRIGRVIGTIGVRKLDTTELSLQCLVDAAGDAAADRVCDQVITTLKMR